MGTHYLNGMKVQNLAGSGFKNIFYSPIFLVFFDLFNYPYAGIILYNETKI